MNFLDDEFDLDKGIKTVVDPTMSDAMKQHNDAIKTRAEITKIQKAPVLDPNPKIKGTEAQKKMHLSEDLFEIVERAEKLNENKQIKESFASDADDISDIIDNIIFRATEDGEIQLLDTTAWESLNDAANDELIYWEDQWRVMAHYFWTDINEADFAKAWDMLIDDCLEEYRSRDNSHVDEDIESEFEEE